MLERYLVTNLGWVSGLLIMACSGTYVKEVGDIGGDAGHGGSGGATTTVAQAAQGGGGLTEDGGGGAMQALPCADCTVDTLGPAEEATFADKHASVSANVLDVTSTRVLREIEATLQINKRTSAAWVVYEEVGGQYELRLDLATKLDPADGDFTSGPFELELQAGHRYAVGVYLNVGACYESDAPESDELSFGSVVGMSFGGGGDYHTTHELVPIYGSQFAMRLHTAMPD